MLLRSALPSRLFQLQLSFPSLQPRGRGLLLAVLSWEARWCQRTAVLPTGSPNEKSGGPQLAALRPKTPIHTEQVF